MVFATTVVDSSHQKDVSDQNRSVDKQPTTPCPFVTVDFGIGSTCDHKITQANHSKRRPTPKNRVGMNRSETPERQPSRSIQFWPNEFHAYILPDKSSEKQPKF